MAEDCGDLAATFDIPAMPAVIIFADGQVRKKGCSAQLFEHCSEQFVLKIWMFLVSSLWQTGKPTNAQVKAQLIGKTEVVDKLGQAMEEAANEMK